MYFRSNFHHFNQSVSLGHVCFSKARDMLASGHSCRDYVMASARCCLYLCPHSETIFYYFLAECFYVWTATLADICVGLAELPLTLKNVTRRASK